MHLLNTSIEISASPEDVRKKFKDFPSLPNYHQGFFKSIGPANPDKPLEPGDEMVNVLEIMTIRPILHEDSPTCFRWGGSGLLGTFNGEHIFRFERSKTNQGATTFIHEEKFTGMLSFLMGDNFVARLAGLRDTTRKGFEGYNRDLKTWCEQ